MCDTVAITGEEYLHFRGCIDCFLLHYTYPHTTVFLEQASTVKKKISSCFLLKKGKKSGIGAGPLLATKTQTLLNQSAVHDSGATPPCATTTGT